MAYCIKGVRTESLADSTFVPLNLVRTNPANCSLHARLESISRPIVAASSACSPRTLSEAEVPARAVAGERDIGRRLVSLNNGFRPKISKFWIFYTQRHVYSHRTAALSSRRLSELLDDA